MSAGAKFVADAKCHPRIAHPCWSMAAFRLAAMTAARQAEATLLAALPRRLPVTALHSVLVVLGARSKTLVGLAGPPAAGMALAIIAARAATLTARAGSADGEASGSAAHAPPASGPDMSQPCTPSSAGMPERACARAADAAAASAPPLPIALAGADAKRKLRGAIAGRWASGSLLMLCSPVTEITMGVSKCSERSEPDILISQAAHRCPRAYSLTNNTCNHHNAK